MSTIPETRSVVQWDRPEFMATLGILPPYTCQDVKQAYLAKVKAAHPDVGGDFNAFVRLQRAFERATEYVRVRGMPSSWLGSCVEKYVVQQAIIDRIGKLGGHVDVECLSWLNKDLGPDFVQITEDMVGIHLHGPHVDDEVFKFFAINLRPLRTLRVLDLARTRIGDTGLRYLSFLPSIKSANLRGTRITYEGLVGLPWLSRLERLDLSGTAISRWRRFKLQRQCRRSNHTIA